MAVYNQQYFQNLPQAQSSNMLSLQPQSQGNWLQQVGNSVGNWWDGSNSDGGWLSRQGMFGGEGSTGWVSPTMQGLGALAGGWNAMQQLDLARDQFNFQKDAYNTNLANQTQLTNQELLRNQALRQQFAGGSGTVSDQWKQSNLLPTR